MCDVNADVDIIDHRTAGLRCSVPLFKRVEKAMLQWAWSEPYPAISSAGESSVIVVKSQLIHIKL